MWSLVVVLRALVLCLFAVGGESKKMKRPKTGLKQILKPVKVDSEEMAGMTPSAALALMHTEAIACVEETRQLKAAGKLVDDTHLVIFIHGYNNADEDVKDRVTALDNILGTDKVATIAWNWVSVAHWSGYGTDQRSAKKIVPFFVEYLSKLRELGQFERIDVLAHSMGNFVLIESLKVAMKEKKAGVLFRDSHVVTLAADVAKKDYTKTLKKILPVVSQWTHYYNALDLALLTSATVNGGKRAGLFASIEGNDKVHSVKWTGISDVANHGYIDAEHVKDDIRRALMDRMPAAERGLQPNGNDYCWAL